MPRDQFVPELETPYAFENRPLPIGWGQTISQPYIVAYMTERLALQLSFLTGVGSDVLVFAVLALLTVTLSNFMSNTATVSLILPVAVALLPGRELEMCLILGLCGSCALLLPVSTPPNAVAYSTGEIQTRDLRPGGLLIGLLGPAVVIFWVLLVSSLVR